MNSIVRIGFVFGYFAKKTPTQDINAMVIIAAKAFIAISAVVDSMMKTQNEKQQDRTILPDVDRIRRTQTRLQDNDKMIRKNVFYKSISL